jgi:hypothetical protein
MSRLSDRLSQRDIEDLARVIFSIRRELAQQRAENLQHSQAKTPPDGTSRAGRPARPTPSPASTPAARRQVDGGRHG